MRDEGDNKEWIIQVETYDFSEVKKISDVEEHWQS